MKNPKKLIDSKPELIKEWDFDKNVGFVDPYTIAACSAKKVWWKCLKCGYGWTADVKHRYQGTGCPKCANESRSKASKKSRKITATYNLKAMHPELLDEWDSEKNNNVTPDIITPGSRKKVWWICRKCKKEWLASVASRVNGTGCPYCSGRNVIIGSNDFATLHPELLDEWNYKKNVMINPHETASTSHKYVWWKCKLCGNEWSAAISDRTRGNGCPTCSFSKRTSEQEQILFYYIKILFPDAINSYRPNWIGRGSEIDIFIPSLNIGIEYDGDRWHQDIEKDKKKDFKADSRGIVLFRLREKGCPKLLSTSICIDVNQKDRSINYIEQAFRELIERINEIYNLKLDVPIMDLKNDYTKILTSYEGNKNEKSLAVLSPSIALEWNYEKNNGLLPENVANQSNKKVWWKCSQCGYEWEGTVNNRIKRGCPVCSNKVVWIGHNDIATTCPRMLDIWNYEKNIDVKPEMFTPGSGASVWWKCQTCGYEWNTKIYHIKRACNNVNDVLCPACLGKKVWKGYNDLLTLRPDLALEWNYIKNKGITPDGITVGSSKTVWWKCKTCGHEWHTSPYNRTKNGSNCPVCAIIKRRK